MPFDALSANASEIVPVGGALDFRAPQLLGARISQLDATPAAPLSQPRHPGHRHLAPHLQRGLDGLADVPDLVVVQVAHLLVVVGAAAAKGLKSTLLMFDYFNDVAEKARAGSASMFQ